MKKIQILVLVLWLCQSNLGLPLKCLQLGNAVACGQFEYCHFTENKCDQKDCHQIPADKNNACDETSDPPGGASQYCKIEIGSSNCVLRPCSEIPVHLCQPSQVRGSSTPEVFQCEQNHAGNGCIDYSPPDWTKQCSEYMDEAECKDVNGASKYCLWNGIACANKDCTDITNTAACAVGAARVDCEMNHNGDGCVDYSDPDWTVKCKDYLTAATCQDVNGGSQYCQWDDSEFTWNDTLCTNKDCSDITNLAACSVGAARADDSETQNDRCEMNYTGNRCIGYSAPVWTKKCKDYQTEADCKDVNGASQYCSWNGSACIDKDCTDITNAAACSDYAARGIAGEADSRCEVGGDPETNQCVEVTAANFAKVCSEQGTKAKCQDFDDTAKYCKWNANAVEGVPKCLPRTCSDIATQYQDACTSGGGASDWCKFETLNTSEAETFNCVDRDTDFNRVCSEQVTYQGCQSPQDTAKYCTWNAGAAEGVAKCLPRTCSMIVAADKDACITGGASDSCKFETGAANCENKDADFSRVCSVQDTYQGCQSSQDTAKYCIWNAGAAEGISKCLPRTCSEIVAADKDACTNGGARDWCKFETGAQNCMEQDTDFTRVCSEQDTYQGCQSPQDTAKYCGWTAEGISKCLPRTCSEIVAADKDACTTGGARDWCKFETGAANCVGLDADFTKVCSKQDTYQECQSLQDTAKYCKWDDSSCTNKVCSDISDIAACADTKARGSDAKDNSQCKQNLTNDTCENSTSISNSRNQTDTSLADGSSIYFLESVAVCIVILLVIP